MNKAQQVIALFEKARYSTDSHDYRDKSRNVKKSKAAKQGWMRSRYKYKMAISRKLRVYQLLGQYKTLLDTARNRTKKIRTEKKREKQVELNKLKQLEKKKFNMFDGID